MYRAAYTTPWVVMGRGNAPPPYTVAYYPEIIPYVGFDSSVSNVSTILTTASLDISNAQDYSPEKPSWTVKHQRNGNSNSAATNRSKSVEDFSQFRSPKTVNGDRKSVNTCRVRKTSGDNGKGTRKSFRLFTNFNTDHYRRQNTEGKGLKRHLTNDISSFSKGRRSSSPCSDTDLHLLSSKRKFCDVNATKSNQNDVMTRPNICVVSPQSPRYLTPKRHSQELCTSPKNANKGDEWELLSCEIWKKYLTIRQSDEKYNCKMRLHDVLHQLLLPHFPTCSLFVVGSSMNGFGCNSSDIDMCLVLQQNDMDQTIDAINVLKHIQKILNRCDFVQKVELIRAKVPILKFKDSVSGCEVDLNVNNTVGIRNTHLLHQYSKIDWRVRPLILIIKIWARAHDINDAKNMTVSSYSLTLMVIHYLQAGISPPILPCLHKLFPKTFLPDSDVKCLRLDDNLCCSPSDNTQSLGQLLVGFLNYFSTFPFGEQAISIRLGHRVSKFICQFQRSRKNNPGQWKCLCIEVYTDRWPMNKNAGLLGEWTEPKMAVEDDGEDT